MSEITRSASLGVTARLPVLHYSPCCGFRRNAKLNIRHHIVEVVCGRGLACHADRNYPNRPPKTKRQGELRDRIAGLPCAEHVGILTPANRYHVSGAVAHGGLQFNKILSHRREFVHVYQYASSYRQRVTIEERDVVDLLTCHGKMAARCGFA